MDTQTIESLGSKLRGLREEKRWSQPQMARQVKNSKGESISAMTWSRYEWNKFKPSLGILQQVAIIFGKPLEYFTEGINIQSDRRTANSSDIQITNSLEYLINKVETIATDIKELREIISLSKMKK